jgi:hypothetical protein
MKVVNFFLIAMFGFSSVAHCEQWQVERGELKYHVHFLTKEVTGVSQKVKGKGGCSGQHCQFIVAAPIRTFESGDSNRDLHMLEVTKGAQFPLVSAKVSLDSPSNSKELSAQVEVQFAGKTKTLKHQKVKVTSKGQKKVAVGSLPILLSDFAVERPSLLGVKVSDNVEIDFSLEFIEAGAAKN